MKLCMAFFFLLFGVAFMLIGMVACVGMNIAGVYLLFAGFVQLMLSAHYVKEDARR